ncbi:MAG: tetratricopeptide repeat protein, partial [Deltaproteobacteria bacterium]|nr:tetratricopeptide repeat protein [Deltaproteobacteria bacterium]
MRSPLGESGADHGDVGGTSLPPLPEVEDSGVEASSDVDGDPEQLLAEASVYLRYGKHDRAIDSLRAIVRQDPTSVAAFAKLGEALEATGQTEHAITSYERGAQAASEAGDAIAFEQLRESVAALDVGRAEALQPPDAQVGPEIEEALLGQPEEGSEAEAEAETEESAEGEEDAFDTAGGGEAEIEFDVEVELDDSEEAVEPAVVSEISGEEFAIDLSESEEIEPSEPDPIDLSESEGIESSEPDAIDLSESEEIEVSGADEVGSDADEDGLVPDFDLSGELELAVEDATVDPAEESADESVELEPSVASEDAERELAAAEESLMEISVEGVDAVEIEISDPALDLAFEDDEEALPEGVAFDESQGEVSLESRDESVGASASATTPAQMAEDLEEADFFYQQGMLDEARAVYDRILALAPSHPGALLRVGEIEAATDGDVDAVSASAIDAADIEVDAGAEEIDADATEVDAGSTEVEADEPELDASATEINAGEPELDADSAEVDVGVDDDAAGMVDLVGEDIFADEDAAPDDLAPDVELGGDPDDDTGRIQEAASEDLEPEAVEFDSPEDSASEVFESEES